MKSLAFILSSLLLHLSLYLAFIAWMRNWDQTPVNNSTSIEISLSKSIEKSTRLLRASRPPGNSPPSGQNKQRPTLQQLGMTSLKPDFGASFQKRQDANPEAANPSWLESSSYWSDEFSAYSGMTKIEIRRNQALWSYIDKNIFESDYLSEFNHTGQVHISFKIDTQGTLVEESLRACAADRILKVIALKAVRQALIQENFKSANPMVYFAQFSWSDYQTCQRLRGIKQNYLSFCHYAEDNRKSFSTAEKLKTYLGALNYGPGALDEIQKYNREQNRRNTEFDPFSNLRNEPDANIGC